MMCTRPDKSWVVTRLSQFLSKPLQCDWLTLKNVLRYLKGTAHYDLCYRKCEKGLRITGYSDSDWASSMEDRRSTSGYCFSMYGGRWSFDVLENIEAANSGTVNILGRIYCLNCRSSGGYVPQSSCEKYWVYV